MWIRCSRDIINILLVCCAHSLDIVLANQIYKLSPPCNIPNFSTSRTKESKTQTFYSICHFFLWRRVERREMKTERLNIKETLSRSKANTRKERYASAVEVSLQDGRQWLSFHRFTRVGSERKCTQENENLFIPCVDACVCIFTCVGVVHNGWKVRGIFEFDVFKQRVFVSLKKTLCHQSLRSFKL